MSQENVETVRRAIAAINDRDVGRYLACCTADVQLRPQGGPGGCTKAPRHPAVLGQPLRRRYRFPGRRRTARAGRPDRVLAFTRVTWHGRVSGIAVADDFPMANIYDLVDGKIRRVRIFLDRHEALEAVGLPTQ